MIETSGALSLLIPPTDPPSPHSPEWWAMMTSSFYAREGGQKWKEKMKPTKIIQEIMNVLDDGSRIDRYIQIDGDGNPYITSQNTSANQYGPIDVNDESLCGYECTQEWAEDILELAIERINERE